jgi:hypothetical protein
MKAICLFLTLFLYILMPPTALFASENGTRNIYIGDIITLNITGTGLTRGELEFMFSGFEIVEIKNLSGGYELSMRTFITGEHRVLLGNKEVVINVGSALEDIEREAMFEGDIWVIEPGFPIHWRMLFYIAAGIFVLSSGFVLIRVVLKKKAKPLNPYQLFLQRSAALTEEDGNYLVDLTFFFKEYIGSIYNRRIIGKTSDEIIKELKEIKPLDNIINEIQAWLYECDKLKFSGKSAFGDNHLNGYIKWEGYSELLRIAEIINSQNEAAV